MEININNALFVFITLTILFNYIDGQQCGNEYCNPDNSTCLPYTTKNGQNINYCCPYKNPNKCGDGSCCPKGYMCCDPMAVYNCDDKCYSKKWFIYKFVKTTKSKYPLQPKQID
ncbi:hypothetical protein ACQ4LE_005087 [Meloidogyne hapla]